MISGKRIHHLDYAKAIAILFVILAHIGFYQVYSIFLFTLPIFFFVTGYSFTAGKRSVKESISRRFKALMPTFWIFMLIYAVIDVIRAYLFGYGNYELVFAALAKTVYGSGAMPFENGITIYLREVVGYKAQPLIGVDVILPANCHLWFLPAAFTGYVMFVSLVERTRKSHLMKVVSIVGLLAFASIEVVLPSLCQLPYGIGRGALGAAFMLIGCWLKECKLLEKSSAKLNIAICSVSALGYIAAIRLGSDGTAFVRSYYGPYGAASLCLTFIGGVCGSVLVLQLCRGIDRIPLARVKNFLAFMGENVLIFYLLHMIPKFILDAIYIVLLHSGESVLLDDYKMALLPESSLRYMILEVILIIAGCALAAKWHQRAKAAALKK